MTTKKQPTADDLAKFDAVQRKADWLAKVLTASNKLDKFKKGGKR